MLGEPIDWGLIEQMENAGHQTTNCKAMASDGTSLPEVFLGNTADQPITCRNETSRRQLESYTFHPGSEVVILKPTFFYLAHSSADPDGPPSLYRARIDATGLPKRAEELASGIENLRALYGIRLSGNHELEYVTAAEFQGNQDLDHDGINEHWHNINTIQLHFLIRSQSGYGESGSNQTQRFLFPDQNGVMVSCHENHSAPSACPAFVYADHDSLSRYRRVLVLNFFLRNGVAP